MKKLFKKIKSLFLVIRNLFKAKNVSDQERDEIKKWKQERRKRRERNEPIGLDVRAMNDNIEKSHKLWKSLSIIVHESKWLGEESSKQQLASHFNTLINESKTNYKKLLELEIRINNELLNKKDIME